METIQRESNRSQFPNPFCQSGDALESCVTHEFFFDDVHIRICGVEGGLRSKELSEFFCAECWSRGREDEEWRSRKSHVCLRI